MKPPFVPLTVALRDAAWLSADRATAYGRIVLLSLLTISIMLALAGRLDHIAFDFAGFWTASELALAGHAEDVYRPAALIGAQAAFYDPAVRGWAAFFYPPIYLLICLPLALVPLALATALFLTLTGAGYVMAIRAILSPRRWALVPILAYPAVWLNVGFAQNGFLSAALFGYAAYWLERRPALAGICFGCLAYKPQLGLTVPLALAAARRWRAFGAATATVLALAAASAIVFGLDPWAGFVAQLAVARDGMERGVVGFAKMISLFGAARLLGGGVPFAYAVQALAALAACGSLVMVVRRRPGGEAEGAAICAGALLCSPFLHLYDLVVLAVPMAWMLAQGRLSGFLPWEKTTLAAAFAVPLIGSVAAVELRLPLTPLAVAALYAIVLRRAAASRGKRDRRLVGL